MDDRESSGRVLERAQELMADAVHAEHTFFTTCGSSLSVKAAMLSVAGPGEKLLIGRDAHRSVISGLIISGVRPIWVEPEWDAERNLAHPPSPDAFDRGFREHPDARGALVTSPSVLLYAGMDGWRRQMVEQGHDLLQDALDLADGLRAQIEELPGLHVNRDEFVGPGRAHDLDPLQVIIDITDLGVLGYRAADWIRDRHHVNLHLSDHRRISAQLTIADGKETTDPLVVALRDLVDHAGELRGGPTVHVADPDELRLELVLLPRDAFFGRAEQVPADQAVGRVGAEMLTPYPPGIPAVVPGERITAPVLDYLRTGVAAGMVVPDAADPALDTVRVAVEDSVKG